MKLRQLLEAPTHLLIKIDKKTGKKKKIMKGTAETIEAFLDDKDKDDYEIEALS